MILNFLQVVGKQVSTYDDIMVITYIYRSINRVRTYVFDLTQDSIFPFSYAENWNKLNKQMVNQNYIATSKVVKNLGNGFLLKSYRVYINRLQNRQNRSIKFQRVVCDGCDYGFRQLVEDKMNLDKYEYPKVKASLSFCLKKEIQDSILQFEKMSVNFFKQGVDVYKIQLSVILEDNMWIRIAYGGVILVFSILFLSFVFYGKLAKYFCRREYEVKIKQKVN